MSRGQKKATRKNVPRHDPVPPRHSAENDQAASEWKRYRSMMKWMVLASAVTVGLSLLYLSQYEELRLHMVIATIAGVGLTVLVGTGLMGLVFLSSRSGHDEDANRGDPDDR
jgi:hypothetical protein